MSETPRYTPYRSVKDLLKLRARFFGTDISPSILEDGVRMVHLWHTKGPVPHGINMTALIISIQLNDPKYNPGARASRSSLYTLRSAYAEVIITLVNGLLDPFQGEVALPISMLASKIGLPNFFVEFRHAATHDVLPSLETLRFLGEKALVWLEEHFWTDENLLQTPSVTIEAYAGRSVPTVSKSKCISLIKLYKGNQKRGIDNASALSQLQTLSRDQRQHGVLGKLLLNSKVLLSNTSSFSKLKKFYLPLLDVLSDAFSLHLLMGVLSRCFKDHELTANREIVHSWLAYFVNKLSDLAYPISSLHTFESPQEIKYYLKNYIGMLNTESAMYLKDLLDGKSVRTFSAAPSLEDILKGSRGSEIESRVNSVSRSDSREIESFSSRSDSRSEDQSQEDTKRRKQNEPSIFSTFPAWQPTPFGVYPET